MESSHIGPIILEKDCRVTYHEDEKIQDQEYENVMIYCWVPQLLWDTQLWKISVYIAIRWDKIINRRPQAQSLYYLSNRRWRIILQGSTIQHCGVWFRWLHKVMSKLRVRCAVNWRHVSQVCRGKLNPFALRHRQQRVSLRGVSHSQTTALFADSSGISVINCYCCQQY